VATTVAPYYDVEVKASIVHYILDRLQFTNVFMDSCMLNMLQLSKHLQYSGKFGEEF